MDYFRDHQINFRKITRKNIVYCHYACYFTAKEIEEPMAGTSLLLYSVDYIVHLVNVHYSDSGTA